jgi:hypothetical protein
MTIPTNLGELLASPRVDTCFICPASKPGADKFGHEIFSREEEHGVLNATYRHNPSSVCIRRSGHQLAIITDMKTRRKSCNNKMDIPAARMWIWKRTHRTPRRFKKQT